MKKKLLLSVVALTLLLASCGQPAASPTPTEVALEPTETASSTVVDAVEPALADRIQTFEQEIELLREELNIPGMSVAVLQGQEVVFAWGFGYADVENETPATENTPYHIASLTKPFAAAVIMQLVEAGQLDLDAEMAEILKDASFTFPPPATDTIHGYASLCETIIELSKATSGPFAPFAPLFQDYHCDTERITVKHHLTHTSQGTPGEAYGTTDFCMGCYRGL